MEPGEAGDDRFDREDRGFFERAGDEIASWFGDEEAEREEDEARERVCRSRAATWRSRSRRVTCPRRGTAPAPIPWSRSKAPTRTSRSTTGRLTPARCQKSSRSRKGAAATTRAVSASLIPLTSERLSRIANRLAVPDAAPPVAAVPGTASTA